MSINLNRDEVLSLMHDLPINHFLQSRLAHELVTITDNHRFDLLPHELSALTGETTSSPALGTFSNNERRSVVTTNGLGGVRSDDDMGQYSGTQLDELYEKSAVSENKKQCKHQTYGYQCTNKTSGEYCSEHLGKLCVHKIGDSGQERCGRQSDHGCPTELQFVCGAACCEIHSNCGNHNRSYGLGY